MSPFRKNRPAPRDRRPVSPRSPGPGAVAPETDAPGAADETTGSRAGRAAVSLALAVAVGLSAACSMPTGGRGPEALDPRLDPRRAVRSPEGPERYKAESRTSERQAAASGRPGQGLGQGDGAARADDPADRAERLLRVAEKTRDSGDLASALAIMNKAYAANPDDPRPLQEAADTLLAAGRVEDAATVYLMVLQRTPQNGPALAGLGLAYLQAHDVDAALRAFAAARTAGDTSARLMNGWGVALDAMARHDEARQRYKDGIALHPDDVSLRNNLALSEAMDGDLDAAAESLAAAVALPAATARQRQNYALILGLLGRDGEARRWATVDLPADAVEANLAYYASLRGMTRRQAIAVALGLGTGDEPLKSRTATVNSEGKPGVGPGPAAKPGGPKKPQPPAVADGASAPTEREDDVAAIVAPGPENVAQPGSLPRYVPPVNPFLERRGDGTGEDGKHAPAKAGENPEKNAAEGSVEEGSQNDGRAALPI